MLSKATGISTKELFKNYSVNILFEQSFGSVIMGFYLKTTQLIFYPIGLLLALLASSI